MWSVSTREDSIFLVLDNEEEIYLTNFFFFFFLQEKNIIGMMSICFSNELSLNTFTKGIYFYSCYEKLSHFPLYIVVMFAKSPAGNMRRSPHKYIL